MIVSHFNTFLSGGAATAAQRLHRGLRRHGVDSRFQYLAGQLTEDGTGQDEGFFETRWRGGPWLKRTRDRVAFRIRRQTFKRSLRRDRAGQEIFTAPQGQPRTNWPPVGHPSESATRHSILHLHWAAKLIDWTSFFGSLPDEQPIVWTLHDMNPLTGGCHFSGNCERFRTGCGNCPQLTARSAVDISARNFAIKRRALAGKNLHVVAPSEWLIDLAKSNAILGQARSFHRIPYGMPVDRFYPADIETARAELGIAKDRFVICFGAMDLSNRRKGSRELSAALAAVACLPKVTCLVFGSGDIQIPNLPADSVVHAGHLRDDASRRRVYGAADVFVLPSLEDNLPLTGLEAMACGTAVIGFAAGGIPDYVLPDRTGWLAETGDADQLGRCLLRAIREPDAVRRMGHQARRQVLRDYATDVEVNRYVRLYQDLLSQSHQRSQAA